MPKQIRVILDKVQKERETPSLSSYKLLIFSSPERKASGELIGWDSSRCLSIRASTLSNMKSLIQAGQSKSNFIWSIIGVRD